jgi:hypothetical protein
MQPSLPGPTRTTHKRCNNHLVPSVRPQPPRCDGCRSRRAPTMRDVHRYPPSLWGSATSACTSVGAAPPSSRVHPSTRFFQKPFSICSRVGPCARKSKRIYVQQCACR